MSSEYLYFEDVELGDDIGPVTKIVNDEQVVEFVALRDPNPSPSQRQKDYPAQ